MKRSVERDFVTMQFAVILTEAQDQLSIHHLILSYCLFALFEAMIRVKAVQEGSALLMLAMCHLKIGDPCLGLEERWRLWRWLLGVKGCLWKQLLEVEEAQGCLRRRLVVEEVRGCLKRGLVKVEEVPG